MFTARAPGKLFIAGEYAVVDPGHPAILLAVDRYLTVAAHPRGGHPRGTVFSDAYDAPRPWTPGQVADHVTAAIDVVENLRQARHLPAAAYDLHITSDLTRGGQKLGLGSSGAVVVAVVAVLDRLHGLHLTLTERFRLALCATILRSPRASGGDVAASTYGGWIRYTAPDRDRVRAAMERAGAAATIADERLWRGCSVEYLPEPALPLLVGWTGSPADTDTLVAAARASQAPYPDFHADSAAVVDAIDASLRAHAADGLLEAVRRGRRVLARYARERGILIETAELAVLCDAAEAAGGAGKTSGAGGGDCGIAFAPPANVARVLREWEASGITALTLTPHPREGDAR